MALTVPHPDGAISTAANEAVSPELNAANKIVVHVVRAASSWSSEGARHVIGITVGGGGRCWMRDCPKNVHGHYTLASCQIPLSQCLVCSTSDLQTKSMG